MTTWQRRAMTGALWLASAGCAAVFGIETLSEREGLQGPDGSDPTPDAAAERCRPPGFGEPETGVIGNAPSRYFVFESLSMTNDDATQSIAGLNLDCLETAAAAQAPMACTPRTQGEIVPTLLDDLLTDGPAGTDNLLASVFGHAVGQQLGVRGLLDHVTCSVKKRQRGSTVVHITGLPPGNDIAATTARVNVLLLTGASRRTLDPGNPTSPLTDKCRCAGVWDDTQGADVPACEQATEELPDPVTSPRDCWCYDRHYTSFSLNEGTKEERDENPERFDGQVIRAVNAWVREGRLFAEFERAPIAFETDPRHQALSYARLRNAWLVADLVEDPQHGGLLRLTQGRVAGRVPVGAMLEELVLSRATEVGGCTDPARCEDPTVKGCLVANSVDLYTGEGCSLADLNAHDEVDQPCDMMSVGFAFDAYELTNIPEDSRFVRQRERCPDGIHRVKAVPRGEDGGVPEPRWELLDANEGGAHIECAP